MLDLDPRVHFDEEPVVFIHVVEELDRPRIIVADALCQCHGGIAEFLADLRVEVHRRSHLDHFLIAALHRAIAFMEVDHIPVLVAEDLHLDVLGTSDVALEKYGRIPEGIQRLVLCFR